MTPSRVQDHTQHNETSPQAGQPTKTGASYQLILERVELLDEGANLWFSCRVPASYDGRVTFHLIHGRFKRQSAYVALMQDDITADGRYRYMLLKTWLPPFVVDARLRVHIEGQGRPLKLRCVVDRPVFEAAINRELPHKEPPCINAQDDMSHHERMCKRRAQSFEAVVPADTDPLISIVTPVYRPPVTYLSEMLESVFAQTYPKFELILVNVSGDWAEGDELLGRYNDERLSIIEAPNCSISENTNVGIEAAQGDYIAFVDHDDFIERDTLERYVELIREHPQTDLLFCNEDIYGEIDGELRFFGPKYKPGFNIDLLMTHNYICHMLMVSRFVIDQTERTGAEMTGAQDYDVTFKAAECAREIRCVHDMLYHWREHAQSTATNRDSKPYALEAGRLAVQAHLDRTGVSAMVGEGAFPFSYRVHYEAYETAPQVSCIIAELQNPEQLAKLIKTVRASVTADQSASLEFVVATQRFRQTAQFKAVAQSADARFVVCERGASHSQCVNQAVQAATGDFCILLDAACSGFADGWIEELTGPFRRAEVGLCAPMLLDREGLILAHGAILRTDGSLGFAERGLSPDNRGYMTMPLHTRDCMVVLERGMCFRRSDFIEIGGFYEGLDKLSFASFCLSLIERGQLVLTVPYAPLRCAQDCSSVFSAEERELLCKFWPQVRLGDIYLDKELDPTSDHFCLRKES
ncbi:MAG: glycosyltransferase [Atopobiaceae bacterium]|nr:glycosyltransferase [Atopobiaceae bacterium]